MTSTPSPQRAQVLSQVADRILCLPCTHPLRVAIDGIDAAGKTTLADELEPFLRERGRPVIRASVDSFHRPKAERYQRGSDSPEGYFEDSFDLPVILNSLLLPLGPGSGRRFRRAAFDHRLDAPVMEDWQIAPPNAILLFDGVFLLRPELNPHWDYRIFIKISFETSVERGCLRDLPPAEPGALEALRKRYRQRYVAGQQIYLLCAHPEILADLVIDNEEFRHPKIIKQG